MNKTKLNIHQIYLLAPWIVIFCVFWLYPLIYSFVLSLSKYYSLSDQIKFVGLKNYYNLLQDESFIHALNNTFIFTFGTVPITLFLAMLIAIAIDSQFARFKNFYKSTLFLPSVTSLVVMALIFTNLYSPQGYISKLAELTGIASTNIGILLDMGSALIGIMAMDVWISVGYYMIFFYAALQAIPQDYYDNASIYGASKFNTFRYVTLPMLKPTLLFVLIINTIKSFQVFIEIYVMTKGGPLGSTITLVYHIYENAFERADMMGYASAAAYILFAITALFSIIQFKVLGAKNA